MLPWMLLALIALLGAAVLGTSVLRRPTTTAAHTTTAPTTPVVQQPMAPPEVQQAPPARMVLVATTPAGAQVLDGNGQVLCPATPCAIPVPVGRAMPVRIVREAVTLNAALDPNTPNVALDLSAITVPTAPREGATPRRSTERRRNNNGGASNGNSSGNGTQSPNEELPMFLPH
jgi:hypothetical protein